MGIYDSGRIFGIKMYNYTDDSDFSNILYAKKYDRIMTDEEKKEAYLFYTELNNKDDIRFDYYTECATTYEKGIFLMWYPFSLNLFLDKFGPQYL